MTHPSHNTHTSSITPMTLDKAIKTLTGGLPAEQWKLEPNLKDAIKLGIEAMNELQELRETTLWGEWKPLPGETKK